MTKPVECTGVILAGGASRRMGQDKALMILDGKPMIERVALALRSVTQRVIIVADDTARYAEYADQCVPDHYKGVGTLGGIHGGLAAAEHDLIFVVGCDMPFVDPQLVLWFLEAAKGWDAVVLKQGGYVDPLHAVYRKSCLPAVEKMIASGNQRAMSFHPYVRVRNVELSELPATGDSLRSFENVNTRDDWERVIAALRRE